ncbi:hypothetical protein EPN95_02415 [Patescibacteria group bacterium]|nr:MAG: hypothetical protein EPN95_02415 [Patescibacteria group bacterium]
MKDIDFDELDRAVNSLVNPDAKSAPAETAPSEPVVSAPAEQSTTSPLAERRSTGRFMDVVHPSSDMRGSVPARPAEPEATTQLDTSVPSEPQTTPAVQTPSPSDSGTNVEPEATIPEPATTDTSEPLESPFLADAKVEKRPLGAFSDEVHDSSPAPSIATASPTEPDLEALSLDSPLQVTSKPDDHPIEKDTPLPAELGTDLLSIEANEDPATNKAEETPPIPAPDTTPVGPTSITPQYTQQPSTGDKPAGNIFDTAAYKKPQPVKGRKSGLFIVLWIFLLLVVGAGIGAAVYFFVLPRL